MMPHGLGQIKKRLLSSDLLGTLACAIGFVPSRCFLLLHLYFHDFLLQSGFIIIELEKLGLLLRLRLLMVIILFGKRTGRRVLLIIVELGLLIELHATQCLLSDVGLLFDER